jgi:hypothetical protein
MAGWQDAPIVSNRPPQSPTVFAPGGASASASEASAAKTRAETPFIAPKARAEVRKTEAEAREADIKARAAEAERLRNMPDKDAIRESIAQTIEGAIRAKQLSRSRFAATGFGSDIMTGAGSPKYAVEAALAPAKANIAIAKLDELAKKGIKLTPISNTDIELMKNALVGLDTAQDDESFQKAMDTIVTYFGKALSKLDREPTAEGARAALEARRRAAEGK